jgi:hypothetical protein
MVAQHTVGFHLDILLPGLRVRIRSETGLQTTRAPPIEGISCLCYVSL